MGWPSAALKRMANGLGWPKADRGSTVSRETSQRGGRTNEDRVGSSSTDPRADTASVHRSKDAAAPDHAGSEAQSVQSSTPPAQPSALPTQPAPTDPEASARAGKHQHPDNGSKDSRESKPQEPSDMDAKPSSRLPTGEILGGSRKDEAQAGPIGAASEGDAAQSSSSNLPSGTPLSKAVTAPPGSIQDRLASRPAPTARANPSPNPRPNPTPGQGAQNSAPFYVKPSTPAPHQALSSGPFAARPATPQPPRVVDLRESNDLPPAPADRFNTGGGVFAVEGYDQGRTPLGSPASSLATSATEKPDLELIVETQAGRAHSENGSLINIDRAEQQGSASAPDRQQSNASAGTSNDGGGRTRAEAPRPPSSSAEVRMSASNEPSTSPRHQRRVASRWSSPSRCWTIRHLLRSRLRKTRVAASRWRAVGSRDPSRPGSSPCRTRRVASVRRPPR